MQLDIGRAQKDVRNFHKKFHQPVCQAPTIFGDRMADTNMSLRDFRIALIEEESRELVEAIKNGNLVKIAREAMDLIYVTIGTCVTLGIRIDPIWKIVHRANMAKQYDPDNRKPIKPEGWADPDEAIKKELNMQCFAAFQSELHTDWTNGDKQ